MDVLSLIGRKSELFDVDVLAYSYELNNAIRGSKVLVIGGGGSIGRAVSIEIFKRNPKLIHVVDLSENNLVELVRDIRSSVGYGDGDFKTFAIDCGSLEFSAMVKLNGPYDYVFNLSALKHVRSERDPYTLMRLIKTNIYDTLSALHLSMSGETGKYFCVSTDKAANPVNMMGASKRIMELLLMKESLHYNISMSRFANVAFSDGSLLHGFTQRISKGQPIAAPRDVKRYFVTPKESGELCVMSGLLGENRDIFFPKLSPKLHLISFSDIATNFLNQLGLDVLCCESEGEARRIANMFKESGKKITSWPCYFFDSDTTGEKDFEEFYMDHENLDFDRFSSIGVIKNSAKFDCQDLDSFTAGIDGLRRCGEWDKAALLALFQRVLPEFSHKELGKDLDQKM